MTAPSQMLEVPVRGREYDPKSNRWYPALALSKPRTVLPPGYADQILLSSGLEVSPYRSHPNLWIEERLGERPWSKQQEINDSIVKNRYTAVQSCHDTGKSWDMSRIACWWLDVHPPGQAFVVTTAPTYNQVAAILWREIDKARTKAEAIGRPLPGRTTLDCQWYMGRELVAYGRKPADHNQAAFQGIHARFVLVIIDEACGVVKPMFEAVDSLATNEDARVVAIGNPDDASSYFFQVCQPGSGWNLVAISAFDSPNFTDEEVTEEVSKSLISKAWVEERKKRWGEDSPVYISKVLGQFPQDSEDGVVPGSWAFRCKNAPKEEPATDKPVNEAGLDCGAGGDESVFVHRLGNKYEEVWADRNPDTMATADKAHMECIKRGVKRIKVDVIGIGKGIADALKRLSRGRYEVVFVNVGERSNEPERFPKLRDELWWAIGREYSENGHWDLSAMSDDVIAQLTAPKYHLVSGSRQIKVEPKEDTVARIGSSPDKADALLLAAYPGRAKQRWRVV